MNKVKSVLKEGAPREEEAKRMYNLVENGPPSETLAFLRSLREEERRIQDACMRSGYLPS